MAGRIRSIKPEILEDETACALSDAAWRLWVSLWVLADDHGNVRLGPRYVAAQVWQDTARDAQPTIDELLRTGMLLGYGVSSERFAHIKGWDKHQRVDNAGKPRVPQPEEADDTWIPIVSTALAATRGQPPQVAVTRRSRDTGARSPAAGTTTTISTTTTDHDHHAAPAGPDKLAAVATPNTIAAVHAHYTALRLKNRPRARPPKLKPAEERRAKVLLAAGYTHDDLRLACEGLFLSPHHLGQNDRNTDYLEFFHALGEKVVDGFIAAADAAKRAPGPMALGQKNHGPPAAPPADLLDRMRRFGSGHKQATVHDCGAEKVPPRASQEAPATPTAPDPRNDDSGDPGAIDPITGVKRKVGGDT